MTLRAAQALRDGGRLLLLFPLVLLLGVALAVALIVGALCSVVGERE